MTARAITREILRNEEGQIVGASQSDQIDPIRVVRDKDGLIVRIDQPDRLGIIRDQLATATRASLDLSDRLNGWQRVDENLQINIGALEDAARTLHVAWPIHVRWMTPADEAKRNHQWGGETHGYRACSNERKHTICIRAGYTATQTAHVILHELVHCWQVERLGSHFDHLYLARTEEFERDARELADLLVDRFDLVRQR